MNTYLLTVSSPDGYLLNEEVQSLSLRGAEGDLAILAGHIPFVTTVKPCECHIQLADGTKRTGRTEGGILSVSDKEVSLLSGSFKFTD